MPKRTLARATATRCSHTHTVHLIPSLISASGRNNPNRRFLEGTVANPLSACNLVARVQLRRLLAPQPDLLEGAQGGGDFGVVKAYTN